MSFSRTVSSLVVKASEEGCEVAGISWTATTSVSDTVGVH